MVQENVFDKNNFMYIEPMVLVYFEGENLEKNLYDFYTILHTADKTSSLKQLHEKY